MRIIFNYLVVRYPIIIELFDIENDKYFNKNEMKENKSSNEERQQTRLLTVDIPII